MTEQKTIRNSEKALSDVIRKELVSERNRRFLDRMPDFRPDMELPARLLDLLGEIDRTEGRRG